MKRFQKRCPWCLQIFIPNPRLKERQKSCGQAQCKHHQKIKSHQLWKKKEKLAYQQNLKDWRANHPQYWKNYRQFHPDYTERNKIQSKIRKSLSQLGLQKRIDILQLTDNQTEYWNFPGFAKQPRSLTPLIWAYSHHQNPGGPHESQSYP